MVLHQYHPCRHRRVLLCYGYCYLEFEMILPPLPEPLPNGYYAEECMCKYALLAIKTVCGGKHPKKFSAEEVKEIRIAHATGHGYKQVNKHHPMSEKTFYNIVNKQGAYK